MQRKTEEWQSLLAWARSLTQTREYTTMLDMLEDFEPEPSSLTPDTAQICAEILALRARARQVVGYWGPAEQDCRKVLAIAPHLRDRSPLVEALQVLGEYQKDQGEIREATESHLNAARMGEAIGDRVRAAEAHLSLAAIHSKSGDVHAARQQLDRTFELLEGLEDAPRVRSARSAALIQKAIDGFRQGHYDEMATLLEQALDLLEGDSLALEAAEAHRFLGVAASVRGQHRQALEQHLRAMEVFDRAGCKFGQAKMYNSIGQAFLEMDRPDEAIHFFSKAERMCSELGAHSEAATLYGKLGRAHMLREDYDRAIEYFQKDLQISKASGGKRALAYIHRNLGQGLREKGDMKLSVVHFRESLALFQQVGDELNTARLYQDLCSTYSRQGNPDLARNMAQRAISLFMKLQNDYEVVYMNTLLGEIARGQKDFVQAESFFQEALVFLSLKEPTPRLADTLYQYGLLQMDMGEKDRALENFIEALRLARMLNLRRLSQDCFSVIEELDVVRFVRTLVETL